MAKLQYTIRGIPERLDKAIRKLAAKDGKSINETVLDALKAGVGFSESSIRYSDLDDLVGSWVNDPEFDRAIQEMHRVDPELWK